MRFSLLIFALLFSILCYGQKDYKYSTAHRIQLIP